MQKFGRLLHPVQDFYAHTNWIEQGRADIFENSVGQWPLLGSYSINNNAIMIEGNPPPGYIAAANMASKTILVRISNTAPFLGIASGVYPNDNDETHCPAFFRVSHGDQN
jgi:hypothetical protein